MTGLRKRLRATVLATHELTGITASDLIAIHRDSEDPQASTLHCFITVYKKWPFWIMPLTIDESILLGNALQP